MMKSKIININGLNCFQVDDKIIDSLAFKSFRPTKKNITDFYNAGVRIFHIYCSGLPSGLKVPYSLFGETWFGDHIYDFTNLDRQIEFYKENTPDGYAFINVQVDTRPWWLEQNPGNVNSFTNLSQVACNEKWRKDTADYIKALIKHVEDKYNNYVIGYFLLGGYTTEWFSQFDHEEPNSYKIADYKKYLNNDNAIYPSKEILTQPKNELFLRAKINEVKTFRKYHNELIADTVLYYAREAQDVLNHNKILGFFFGYILELIDERLWEAGHIEFDRINQSKDIDILATPSSYQFRGYDDVGAFMLLIDSLRHNNKACFISFDHTTFLLPTLADDPKRECADKETSIALKLLAEMRARNPKDLLKTREQTIQAMRREFMQRMYKRVGYWWFDMFEGWFYDDALMEEVKHEIEISKKYLNVDKSSISEVAVFISGQSLYNVSKNSELNTEIICNQRGGLNRMGAPYDIYSLSDINSLDVSKYKLCIFIGAFELTDEQRDIINSLKKEGRTLLFIGPVDYSSKGLEGTKKMLEMTLKLINNEERIIKCEKFEYGYCNPKLDSFAAIDQFTDVIGRYASSNEPGYVLKQNDEYNILFSGLGNLNYLALKEALKIAGVHIYNQDDEGVYITNNFFGIYAPLKESILFHLKEDGTYVDIFTNTEYQCKNGIIKLDTSINNAQMLYKVR